MLNTIGYKILSLCLLLGVVSVSATAQVLPFGILNSNKTNTISYRDNTTLVVEVTSNTGRIWMDRNLGATRAATNSQDAAAYGDLYQWGRGADGHQIRTSATTTTLSNSDSPGNGDFILAPDSPYDWRIPQNNSLWQGESGVNNPCPSGYRLPSEAEWTAEQSSWSSSDANGAFASPLKLSMGGLRFDADGSIGSLGSYAYYWSGTISSGRSRRIRFNTGALVLDAANQARGHCVRCIKDEL